VRDIVLVDKGDLDDNPGSTSHTPGGSRTIVASHLFTRLGSASRERYDSSKRLTEMGLTHGIEANLLGPTEAVG